MNRQKNCGFGIADCGLKNARSKKSEQSTIRNPQSAIARPGLSLTEVLISMGIMTVGLLGVAAIFPVGSHYVQKGDIYDRASAVGQSAFGDLVTRGMLEPAKWLALNQNIGNPQYDQLMGPWLSNVVAMDTTAPPPGAINVVFRRNAIYGQVFVLDPLGVAAFQSNGGTPVRNTEMRLLNRFPGWNTLANARLQHSLAALDEKRDIGR